MFGHDSRIQIVKIICDTQVELERGLAEDTSQRRQSGGWKVELGSVLSPFIPDLIFGHLKHQRLLHSVKCILVLKCQELLPFPRFEVEIGVLRYHRLVHS
jgi:hypothetical protein